MMAYKLLTTVCAWCSAFPCVCIRTAPCVCGKDIVALGQDVGEAIRQHQATPQHCAWRARHGL